MRIAIGGILHETSTFVQTTTTMSDFQHATGIARGAEMVERFRGTNVCSGGFIDRLDQEDGVEIVPLLRASAFPGGLIDAVDYKEIKTDLLERLAEAERVGGPVDGVLLDLHGAMVTETTSDGEGTLLARIRSIAPDLPIAISLDLHANLTDDIIDNCDVLVGYKTYPHIDMYEAGEHAGRIMVRMLNGEVRPVMRWGNRPILAQTLRMGHDDAPMGPLIEQARALEQDGLLAASVKRAKTRAPLTRRSMSKR